jgi:hypothetical protein
MLAVHGLEQIELSALLIERERLVGNVLDLSA